MIWLDKINENNFFLYLWGFFDDLISRLRIPAIFLIFYKWIFDWCEGDKINVILYTNVFDVGYWCEEDKINENQCKTHFFLWMFLSYKIAFIGNRTHDLQVKKLGNSLHTVKIREIVILGIFHILSPEGNCESSAREGPRDSLSILICGWETKIEVSILNW